LPDKFQNHANSLVNCTFHGWPETNPFARVLNFASDDDHSAEFPSERPNLREHVLENHVMRIGDRLIFSNVNLGLDYVKGSRRSTPRNRIDDHHQFEFVEQLVREMYAAYSVVLDDYIVGHWCAGESPRHLDAETIVTEKDVPDSRN
jgi:hypothetical protein